MNENRSELIIYQTEDGKTRIDVHMDQETVWLTRQQMAELFDRNISVIGRHIRNIFEEGELQEKSNVQKMHIANSDKPVEFYCMTERYDNHTLWENYAKNYTGFCIEYSFHNFAVLPFEDYKKLIYMFPMTYRKKKPYFNMALLLDGVFRQFAYKDDSWQRDSELDADLNMQLFFKHKDYEYEHEWRFSIKSENENKQKFPFVSALYVGKGIAASDLAQILQIAKHLHVPVYQQTVNSAHNGFDYILIEEAKQ